MSWCNSILDTLKAFDPLLLSIVNASICPLNFDWDGVSEEEGKCMQRNAQATYLLTKALSSSVEEMIIRNMDFLKMHTCCGMMSKKSFHRPHQHET
jgi:hypothetical protein